MFTFRLFGVGKAEYGGQPLAGFPDQQTGQLLSYLILNRGQQHHRERLAALFWTEHTTEKARKNLRNALSRLHKCFETVGAKFDDYIAIEEDRISFRALNSYWLDVEVFAAATSQAQGLSGTDLSNEQAHQLEQAIGLYEGDLLESIYEDWCLHERERLRLAYLNTLERLMNFHGAQGNYDQGLRYGHHLLEVDPTREKIHCNMIAFYWCQGDRNAAIAQYKVCHQVLRQELGLKPMDETRRLYQQILQHPPPEKWIPDSHLVPARDPAVKKDSRHTEFILQKIRSLQNMMDEFGAELRSIEHVLKNSSPSGQIDPSDEKGAG